VEVKSDEVVGRLTTLDADAERIEVDGLGRLAS
jgi:hypothetical protein